MPAGKRILHGLETWVRNDILWLLTFIAVILVVPIFLSSVGVARTPFDEAPLEELRKKQAEVVMIGDSMLETRIDPKRLAELTTTPFLVLEQDGSASARWYLFLKNYLAPSALQPKHVVIFFRDRYLTDPEFRTSGQYLKKLHRAMLEDEPVVDRLIEGRDRTRFGWLAQAMEKVYPIQLLRDSTADKLVDRAEQINESIMPDGTELAHSLDQTFDVKKLRADTPPEYASEDLIIEPFNASPDASFLPHILDLADLYDWKLTFYRVKRRPQSGNTRTDDPELQEYIRDLRKYLESRGASLIDATGDESIGIEYYSDGDHVSEAMRERYTEKFFEKNQGLFQ